LPQFTRVTDGQTDRIRTDIAIPRLHYMQRGKNDCYNLVKRSYVWPILSAVMGGSGVKT